MTIGPQDFFVYLQYTHILKDTWCFLQLLESFPPQHLKKKRYDPKIQVCLEYIRLKDSLRIFQDNGLKLDTDLKFSGLVQNVCIYRMAKSKKNDRSVFT